MGQIDKFNDYMWPPGLSLYTPGVNKKPQESNYKRNMTLCRQRK